MAMLPYVSPFFYSILCKSDPSSQTLKSAGNEECVCGQVFTVAFANCGLLGGLRNSCLLKRAGGYIEGLCLNSSSRLTSVLLAVTINR